VATGSGGTEVSFDHRDVFLIDGASASASWGVSANAGSDQQRWEFRLMARTSRDSPPETVCDTDAGARVHARTVIVLVVHARRG
jgi:hypothetical protein